MSEIPTRAELEARGALNMGYERSTELERLLAEERDAFAESVHAVIKERDDLARSLAEARRRLSAAEDGLANLHSCHGPEDMDECLACYTFIQMVEAADDGE